MDHVVLYSFPPVSFQCVLHLGYQEAVDESVAVLFQNILEESESTDHNDEPDWQGSKFKVKKVIFTKKITFSPGMLSIMLGIQPKNRIK